MIRLVTFPQGQELSLPGSGISLDIVSPYFDHEAIPGITTLPLELPWTRENLRGLNFPHQYRGPGGPPPVIVDCYIDQVRWQRGKMVYLSVDAQGKKLRYNFVSGSTDLATLIKDVKLPTLDLGTVALEKLTSTADYALMPVRNTTFFGDVDKAPKDYSGYLNYFPTAPYLAPMPYLVPILRKVLAIWGYTVVGDWIENPEIQKLVIYSDRLVDSKAATFDLARHVPNIDVADFLLALQGLFCLGIDFNVATAQVRITALRDVAAAAAAGQRARPGAWQSSVANSTTGFTLSSAPDDNDELDKTLDTSWQKLTIGAGGEAQQVRAGTLHMVSVANDGRIWQVPAYEGKGAVPGNADVGDESKVGLRVLFDRGSQPDSQGVPYVLASALSTNIRGEKIGAYSLHWNGPDGLVVQWHQAWLTFRARAVQHEYSSEFRIADLLTLDPAQADLVDFHLCLWEKVSISIDATARLTKATLTYQELL
jgi:hypothetical protein